jgi:hypothetical protein
MSVGGVKLNAICEKVKYDSFFDAENAISGFKSGRAYGKSRRRLSTKKPKRAYKCEVCGKYHITSQKNKR